MRLPTLAGLHIVQCGAGACSQYRTILRHSCSNPAGILQVDVTMAYHCRQKRQCVQSTAAPRAPCTHQMHFTSNETHLAMFQRPATAALPFRLLLLLLLQQEG